MKWIYAVLFLIPLNSYCQFEIGSTSAVFTDAERDRDIETFIYYPAEVAGADVALSDGVFPVISVGHGFVMTYVSYTYIWEHFVPLGYIVVLPNTETTVAVSHGDFGADLSFVIHAIQNENTIASSLFYEHVSPLSAVIGHSMGGGAAVLAAASDAEITTLITLAAAETSPSAIAAASAINQPSLTFAGGADCVTPPADHQEPIYANLSDCKGYALILEGSHCQFANSNFLCEFGELGCPEVAISGGDQHAAVLEILTPWLRAYLKLDYAAWEEVLSLEGENDTYNFELDCNDNAPVLSVPEQTFAQGVVYPNPSTGMVTVPQAYQFKNYRIYSLDGRIVQMGITAGQLDISLLHNGVYLLQLDSVDGLFITQRLEKIGG